MKQKDIIQLAVAIIVLVAAGFVIYKVAVPAKKGTAKGAMYEVVYAIPDSFDPDALGKLNNSSNARDFYLKPDLHSGIGNPQPFTPLK